MYKGLIHWFKKFFQKEKVVTLNFQPNIFTQIYLSDPTEPNLILNQQNAKETILPMHVIGDIGSGYALGSIQNQASSVKITINNTLQFLNNYNINPVKNWVATNSLSINPRAGHDANAHYDRNSIKFFYFYNNQDLIFFSDSRSIVVHELAHAYLDSMKPDWWNTQALEVWALHESFGDIIALLQGLNYEKLIEFAIKETNGNLLNSNIITKIGCQISKFLHKQDPSRSPNFLRDATEYFQYIEPEKLPKTGKHNQLIAESHSFSRVFTNCIWQIIVKIANSKTGNLIDNMKISRDIITGYLLKAIHLTPKCVRIYKALAQNIILVDQSLGGKYYKIINDVFVKHKILKIQVSMLQEIEYNIFCNQLNKNFQILELDNIKTVVVQEDKKIRLQNYNKNPLFGLDYDVADEQSYSFIDDKLSNLSISNLSEQNFSAEFCLDYLHNNNLVGDDDKKLFYIDSGVLKRKQIMCKCNKPNYCDPNAPEFGKPWKPANNSGCSQCYSSNCKPQSCNCDSPTPIEPQKFGCYSKIVNGNKTTYKYGSNVSRTVC